MRKPFRLNSNSRPFPGHSCLFPGYSRLTCFDAELKNGMNERHMQEKSQALIIQGQGRCLRPALPNYDSCPRGISEISCPNRQPSYFSARQKKLSFCPFTPKSLLVGGRRYRNQVGPTSYASDLVRERSCNFLTSGCVTSHAFEHGVGGL